jgi:hypothetical protein
VLCLSWYGMHPMWHRVIAIINYCYMGIFTSEAVFKIYAYRTGYFKDPY